MAYQWKNQVVLITGAAIGIGAEVVKRIAGDAKHVAILDIDVASGTELQNTLNSKYGANKIKFYQCDVTSEEQFVGTIKTVKDANGYIDVVINNAGIMNDAPNVYRKAIEVNVTAVVTGTLTAIEIMRKDKGGRGGTVINIASIAGLIHNEMLPIYMGTKSAVIQFSNCIGMNEYYSRTGVRVVAVCFGATSTSLLSPKKLGCFDLDFEDVMMKLIKRHPPQTPDYAAEGVVQLFKTAKTATTWLIDDSKPALDITSDIDKAYEIMASKLSIV